MKRMIFIYGCMLTYLFLADPLELKINQPVDVNKLAGWEGSEMAFKAVQKGGEDRQAIVEHCALHKDEVSIRDACIIATRL